MKMKKRIVLLSVLCVIAMMLFAFGAAAEQYQIYTSDFSAGTDGWVARSMGTAVLQKTENGIKITGRTSSWNSPGRDFALTAGAEYTLTAEVMQDEAATANFMISIAHSKGGQESYENLASGTAKQGEVTKLTGTWTAGEYDTYILYVETSGSPTLSFTLCSFSVESNTAPGAPAKEAAALEGDWYEAMLSNAQVRLGNNTRLVNVLERAKNGENITVAVIGGSITEGAGANKYEECWAMRLLAALREEYGAGDGSNINLVNAGVGGTPSTFGALRYGRDILSRVKDDDGLPDIVIIEYAVNDGGEPTNHGCYEALVRNALNAENQPAVLLLFSVFPTGYTLQDQFIPVGNAYDLTMVSMKNSAFPYVGDKWTTAQFFFDQYHPTTLGHQVMADAIMAAIRADAAQETPAEDVTGDIQPVYTADYTTLRSIFASDDNSAINLSVGSFSSDDTASYRNTPVGRVCGTNFSHMPLNGNDPLTFTASFKQLLISYRTVSDASYGKAEVYVDGVCVKVMNANTSGAWGQSETCLAYAGSEVQEHTVEIRMAEGNETKRFTMTVLGYTE